MAGITNIVVSILIGILFMPSGAISFQNRYENLTEEEAAKVWLEEIVPYIITKQEREIFKSLTTSEERMRFIDTFWARRDPDPETPENEYKLEHYRRITFANKLFGAGRPGWKTDRGRIYILLGPPDSVDADPMGRWAHQYPTEVWSYRNPPHPALPPHLEIAFVDRYFTGDYEITFNLLKDSDASRQREALLGEPGFDPWTAAEIRSLNFGRPGTLTSLADGLNPELERLSELALVAQIPERELRPLSEEVEARFTFDTGRLEAEPQIDFYRASEGQILIPVTLRLAHDDFAYRERSNGYEGGFEALGRILTKAGEVVDEFTREELLVLPRAQRAGRGGDSMIYQLLLYAPPGEYDLELALRDNTSGGIRAARRAIRVPDLGSSLSLSTVALAHQIQKVDEPPPRGKKDPFLFGEYKVVPNPNREFETGATLSVYFEIYNMALDEQGKNSVELAYVFRREGRLYRKVDKTYLYPTDRRERSVISAIPLKEFAPGHYRLQVTVTDRVANDSVTSEIDFEVTWPELGDANPRR